RPRNGHPGCSTRHPRGRPGCPGSRCRRCSSNERSAMSDRSGRPARRPPDQEIPPMRERNRGPSRRPPAPSPATAVLSLAKRNPRPVRPSCPAWPSCPPFHPSPFSSLAPVQGKPPAPGNGTGSATADRPTRRAAGSSVPYMRLGVLDVGSNTVHLLVVDAHPGARPLPAHSHKTELRLAQLLDDGGAIGPDGVDRLIEVVHEALQAAE